MAARRDTPLAGEDLFGSEVPPTQNNAGGTESASSALTHPLADRLRPATLADVVGQGHLLGPDGALTVPGDGSAITSALRFLIVQRA